MTSITSVSVATPIALDIKTRVRRDDVLAHTSIKGVFGNTQQLRVNFELNGRVVSVAARKVSCLENPHNLNFFTRLFWKRVTVQYQTTSGQTVSEFVLLNRNSLSKRMSQTSVEAKIDAACTALSVSRNQISELLKKLYSQEISYRLADKKLSMEGNPIEVISSHGTLFLKTTDKFYNLDADEALSISPADFEGIRATLGIPLTLNALKIFNEAFKKKAEFKSKDLEMTCQGIKIYSKSGVIFASFKGRVLNLITKCPVIELPNEKVPLSAQVFIQRNHPHYREQYIARNCKPFIISKSDSGLDRSILFYSPSKIYYLNNSHEAGSDPILGRGSFKKVVGAWDMLTGERKAVSVMAAGFRSYFNASKGAYSIIVKSTEFDIQSEIKIRRPFKGEEEIVQTEAVFRYRSAKRDMDKVMIIEELYDSDLFKLIKTDKSEADLDKKLTLDQKQNIAKKLLRGLDKLHKKGYVHRDIKPQNILVKKSGTDFKVAIADLGLAVAESDTETKMKSAGTLRYFSPEYARAAAFGDESEILKATSKAHDIYAIGLVINELFNDKAIGAVGTAIQHMLKSNPGERATLDQIEKVFPFRG